MTKKMLWETIPDSPKFSNLKKGYPNVPDKPAEVWMWNIKSVDVLTCI